MHFLRNQLPLPMIICVGMKEALKFIFCYICNNLWLYFLLSYVAISQIYCDQLKLCESVHHWWLWNLLYQIITDVYLRNSAFQQPRGWVALSSLVVRRLFVPPGDTSSHLHYMMFQTIQTIYFLWGYDPGNMSVSFIAELSPVYCCLVYPHLTRTHTNLMCERAR